LIQVIIARFDFLADLIAPGRIAESSFEIFEIERDNGVMATRGKMQGKA
jgi:hypothetical protein